MKKRNRSQIFVVAPDQRAVAMMIRGTSDSVFQLERGVPSNDQQRLEEYLWADVVNNGTPVQLKSELTNPITIDIPGTYYFRNEGTDDEYALIDVTVYKK